MASKSRNTVRKLMIWVGAIAVLLAFLRSPYEFIRAQRRFATASREGADLVLTYYTQCPADVSPANWNDAVTTVQIAWCNVVFSPSHFAQAELDVTLPQVHRLVNRATPAQAEGDLYLILDVLAHAPSMAGAAYLSNRRWDLKQRLQGYGQPSSGVVNYALFRLNQRSGDSSLATLFGGLRSSDWQIRVACCRAIGQFGLGLASHEEAQAAVSALIRVLSEDADSLVREITIECFHEMGPATARARDLLIQTLRQDPSARVRWQAARTLARVSNEAKIVVPALIDALKDGAPSVRRMAIVSLSEIKRAAIGAQPALCEALHDRENEVRKAAVNALTKVAPSSDSVVSHLSEVLEHDSDSMVRDEAAGALGQIGPPAAAAVPTLLEALNKDPSASVRGASALALARIGPADSRLASILARTLRQDDVGHVRESAAEALALIGEPAACAVTALIDATRDRDDRVWTPAAEALGRIGPEARRSLPALVKLLTAKDTRTQQAAINSLSAFGPEARKAITPIRAIRDAPPERVTPQVRNAADVALRKIDPQP